MVKVTINGEVYPFDSDHYPLAEAIELEEGLGMDFAEWEQKLTRGSAKAIAGYVWLVLRRNDQDVPLADVLSGAYAVDTREITIDADDAAGPTTPPSAPGTGSGSEASASSTTTPRRKSGSSASPSSTPSSGT